MNKKGEDKRKKLYFLLICITAIITITSGTYAYFTAAKTATNTITGQTATVSFGLAVRKVTRADEIIGVIPMDDELAPQAAENMCYDDYENAVCQVYEITVTNTGNSSMYLDGYIVLRMVNDDEMRFTRVYYDGDTFRATETEEEEFDIANVKSGIPLNTENFNNDDDKNALFIRNEFLKTEETKKFYAMMWIHNLKESQDDLQGVQNAFHGSVTFNSAQGNEVTAVFN